MNKETDMMPQKSGVPPGDLATGILPEHLAVIMDGNGRWALQRGLSRSDGHRAGVRAARAIVRECRALGIRFLTLYTFSQENWGRPQDEVRLLFELLVEFLSAELRELEKQSVRLNVYGDISALPAPARKTLAHAMKRTAHCSQLTVNLALNYSGRGEIIAAARSLVRDGIAAEEITEETLRERLFSKGHPDPDLIIRTSGELRLSNFLTFQSAYSEFYFTELLWPDFTPEALREALKSYAARGRRFGLTQEQVSS